MKFDFEKFEKVTSLLGKGVLVLRSDEEKATFKKYLDEKQCSYDEKCLEGLLPNEGLFYDCDTVLSCGLLDYDRYYMEDFIVKDFISNEKDLISFLKEI